MRFKFLTTVFGPDDVVVEDYPEPKQSLAIGVHGLGKQEGRGYLLHSLTSLVARAGYRFSFGKGCGPARAIHDTAESS